MGGEGAAHPTSKSGSRRRTDAAITEASYYGVGRGDHTPVIAAAAGPAGSETSSRGGRRVNRTDRVRLRASTSSAAACARPARRDERGGRGAPAAGIPGRGGGTAKTTRRRGTTARAASAARTRLDERGVHALSDREAITILLGRAPAPGLDALLDGYGVHALVGASPDDLREPAGLGADRTAADVAAIETGRRTLTRPPARRPRLEEPCEIAPDLLPASGALPAKSSRGASFLPTHRPTIQPTYKPPTPPAWSRRGGAQRRDADA